MAEVASGSPQALTIPGAGATVEGPGNGSSSQGSAPAPSLPASEGRKISCEDIQLVQNLIERCLQLYMSQREVISTLQFQAKIEPGFTSLVWQKLEEQNPEFFRAYYARLKVKEQMNMFNSLLEQQSQLVNRLRMQGPGPKHGSMPPHHMDHGGGPSLGYAAMHGPSPGGMGATVPGHPVGVSVGMVPAAGVRMAALPGPSASRPRSLSPSLTANGIPAHGHAGYMLPPHTSAAASDGAKPADGDGSGGSLEVPSDLGLVNGTHGGAGPGSMFPFGSPELGLAQPMPIMPLPLEHSPFGTSGHHGPGSSEGPGLVSVASREGLGSLGHLPRNFSLSDLAAEFPSGPHTDDFVGSLTASPPYTSDTEVFLQSPDQDGGD